MAAAAELDVSICTVYGFSATMIPGALHMAHGASTRAPVHALDIRTRALRSQHSAWHWRLH
eukprot:1052021-Pyramimonas_sp.AAC.1